MSVFGEILLIDLIFFPECDFFHFFHFFVPENLRKALWPSRLKLLIVAWPKVTKRGQSLEGGEAKGFLGMKKGGNLNFALRNSSLKFAQKLFCTLKLVAFDAFLLVLRRSFCEAQDQSACKIWKDVSGLLVTTWKFGSARLFYSIPSSFDSTEDGRMKEWINSLIVK